jgi:hypothetical protein
MMVAETTKEIPEHVRDWVDEWNNAVGQLHLASERLAGAKDDVRRALEDLQFLQVSYHAAGIGHEGIVEVAVIEDLDLDFAESAFDTDDLDDMVRRVEEIDLGEDWEPEAAEDEEPGEETAQ